MTDQDMRPNEQIARVAYEAVRAYAATISESMPSWEQAPGWMKASSINGVEFMLAMPEAAAADVHDEWCDHKRAAGWQYGTRKDPDKKTHPCLVPFHELPLEEQAKDKIFAAVVKAFID